jgi:hypothetical protein
MSGKNYRHCIGVSVFIEHFSIGTLPALKSASPIGVSKGRSQMSMSFVPARQAAVSFAGAFIVAMLFVTAAVGPLPLV